MDVDQVMNVMSDIETDEESYEYSQSESEESEEESDAHSESEESNDSQEDSEDESEDSSGSGSESDRDGSDFRRGCGRGRGRGSGRGRGRGRGRGSRGQLQGRKEKRKSSRSAQPLPFTWKKVKGRDTPPAALPFLATSGISAPLPPQPTPSECFGLFFDDSLWQLIVDRTNTYAQQRLRSMTITPRSLYRNWRDVTIEEVKGMVALVINMGLVQMSNLKDYWNTDETCNIPYFRYINLHDCYSTL